MVLFKLPLVNLETEIKKSELSNEQVGVLKNNSTIGTIYDFIEYKDKKDMFPFGLSNYKRIIYILHLCKILGLKDWVELYKPFAYSFYFNDTWTKDHTNIFMRRVMESNPRIAFFVPPYTISFNTKKTYIVTNHELEILINSKDLLKNHYFIFGLYETISEAVNNEVISFFKRINTPFSSLPVEELSMWATGFIIKNYKEYTKNAKDITTVLKDIVNRWSINKKSVDIFSGGWI